MEGWSSTQINEVDAEPQFADAPVLRRLASIFQGLTPACLMLHDFGCKASTEKPQGETIYLLDYEKIANL